MSDLSPLHEQRNLPDVSADMESRPRRRVRQGGSGRRVYRILNPSLVEELVAGYIFRASREAGYFSGQILYPTNSEVANE